jgi:hypothetical protein
MPSKFSILFLTAICVLFLNLQVFAGNSSDKIWQEIEESAIRQPETERTVKPSSYKVFRANTSLLRSTLEKAPAEFGGTAENDAILTLPLPNGNFSRFKILYSPIMEPELAAKYPELKTYVAQDVDNPHSTARISMTPTGFRAVIFSGYKTVMVDPYSWGDAVNYISYDKAALAGEKNFTCLTGDDRFAPENEKFNFFDFTAAPNLVSNGRTLRIYRLALAATAEYTNVFRQESDTDAQAKARALEQQVIVMTRVNGVYERDLAIRMILVAQNDLIIYTDPATDPYTNSEGSKMLGENQENLDKVILPPNYELGHVFSTGGGGLANIAVPCRENNKARGVTGLFNPRGDPFAIDYVAHELGHQWGANHTFNGGGGNCSGNRSSGSAYEPGSGVTIMGYAGICSGQDLARNSIDSFHVKSIESILGYVNSASGNCSVNVSIENSIPVIALSGSSFDIPKETPFALTANASDANGDTVTYDWQQYDLGTTTSSVPNTDSDGAARPIFRAYSPTTSGIRYFPSLQYILNNANTPPSTYTCGRVTPCLTGETLPSIARTMNFQVIARDNRIGGGAVSTASVQVRVDGASGPFKITSLNSPVTISGGSNQTITWDAANTFATPVSAASVRILLSTDGGQNFTTVLSDSTPNDGSHMVAIPDIATSRARIKIEAVGNIFFDISDADFSISTSTQISSRKSFDFDGDGKADISVFRPAEGVWYLLRSQAGFAASQFGIATDKTVAADYDGDGKTDLAVFRGGSWFRLNSSTATFSAAQFGLPGDIPVTGDFDGDGKSDLTVFRNGVWFIFQSADSSVRAAQFGLTSDKPVTGDFDGDGRADLAVYRAGTWFIMASRDGFSAVSFGIAGDKPVPEDYDGDGKTDFAVYRSGVWHLLRSRDGYTGLQFGISTDTPAAADYDGDGKADISVYRSGSWFLLNSQSGFTAVGFGNATDQPIPAQLN